MQQNHAALIDAGYVVVAEAEGDVAGVLVLLETSRAYWSKTSPSRQPTRVAASAAPCSPTPSRRRAAAATPRSISTRMKR
jgi:hypothetical protein